MAKALATVGLAGIFMLLLSSCATTVKPWTGDNAYSGAGGTMHVVDGIEVWDHGTPSRQFRIVAIIETATVHQTGALGIFNAMSIEGRIAKNAKAAGADAVVPLSTIGEVDSLRETYDLDRTMAAIKYVE